MSNKINNTSKIISSCQNCKSKNLKSILFLGYMPPVNKLIKIDAVIEEQPSYPTELLFCTKCSLMQLSCIVNEEILFPKEYPYTSGTTKILRDNFSDLAKESLKIVGYTRNDLVVDIGSNDGTLLLNFKDKAKVAGITPENIGKIAIKNGIPTVIDYFNKNSVDKILKSYGKAKIVTAANVFAHIDDVDTVIKLVKKLITSNGVFISESHYLLPLIKNVQYDTIYHEHMRYYSLISIYNLLKKHGFRIFHTKLIPSHGGSIRVYASLDKSYSVMPSVSKQLKTENNVVTNLNSFKKFKDEVVKSKIELYNILFKIKKNKNTIWGISAPSRASTLVNYLGLDENIITSVAEVKNSNKIGYYMPGTRIPIVNEDLFFKARPEYALILSWHIKDDIIKNLRKLGYKGKFIIPLPKPRIVS